MTFEDSSHCLKVWNPLVVNEYLKLRRIWKAIWTDIRFICYAKGFTHKEGIDYKAIFFLTSTKYSFGTIMGLISHFDLVLHQMNVKTTFLNDDIDETIYIVPSKDFVSKDSKKMVCKWRNSSIGLSKLPINDIINFIK